MALARERGDELIFLVVLDTAFLGRPAAAMDPQMRETMDHMARSLLLAAADRAREAGVEARMLIREGSPRQQIKAVAGEEGAATVILGRPRGHYDKFAAADLKSFAGEIAAATRAEVRIV